MPALNNPRHERFARFMAEGKTATEAYDLAGYKHSRFNASKLANNPAVKERVIQISNKITSQAAFSQQITKEKLIEWHNEIREQGKESGQLSPAETAIKEISVLTGHRIERAEIGSPGEFDHLSDDDLERLLVERLAELGFAPTLAISDGSTALNGAETDSAE
jgi:phage terminase small subunit